MARHITSHSVGVIAIKKGSGATWNILSFSYTLYPSSGRQPWKSMRIPVETGENAESMTVTARRAIEEEVVENGHPFSFKFVERGGRIFPVFFTLGVDEKIKDKDALHLKAFSSNSRGSFAKESTAIPALAASKCMESPATSKWRSSSD